MRCIGKTCARFVLRSTVWRFSAKILRRRRLAGHTELDSLGRTFTELGPRSSTNEPRNARSARDVAPKRLPHGLIRRHTVTGRTLAPRASKRAPRVDVTPKPRMIGRARSAHDAMTTRVDSVNAWHEACCSARPCSTASSPPPLEGTRPRPITKGPKPSALPLEQTRCTANGTLRPGFDPPSETLGSPTSSSIASCRHSHGGAWRWLLPQASSR